MYTTLRTHLFSLHVYVQNTDLSPEQRIPRIISSVTVVTAVILAFDTSVFETINVRQP